MATNGRSSSRERLSLQTLVIAAVASGVAAIVTSTFWRGGAIVTAAMTPVIVSILKELLARPMESELVRRPVARVRSAAPATSVGGRRFEREGAQRVPAQVGAGRPGTPPPPPRDRAAPLETLGDRALGSAPPVRTYRRRRRRPHVRAAIVTGIAAFAVALVALTVPELIFGGSVASHGTTTFFGGRTEHARTAPNQTSTSPTRTTTTPSQSSSPGRTRTSTTPRTSTSQQAPPSGGQTPTTQSPTPSTPSQSPSPSSPAPQSGGTPPAK